MGKLGKLAKLGTRSIFSERRLVFSTRNRSLSVELIMGPRAFMKITFEDGLNAVESYRKQVD
jgi:hypothetical protein